MPDPDWAIAPDLTQFLTKWMFTHDTKTVVEFGSGASTLLFAGLIGAGGSVTSFEQSPVYAEQTMQALGATPGVTVVTTSIKDGWYAGVKVPDSIDLVLVDGPGPCPDRTRAPAMDAVYGSLTRGSVVVVDDANRSENRAMTLNWMDTYPDLFLRYFEHDRGTIALVKT